MENLPVQQVYAQQARDIVTLYLRGYRPSEILKLSTATLPTIKRTILKFEAELKQIDGNKIKLILYRELLSVIDLHQRGMQVLTKELINQIQSHDKQGKINVTLKQIREENEYFFETIRRMGIPQMTPATPEGTYPDVSTAIVSAVSLETKGSEVRLNKEIMDEKEEKT
jgi:hypothetical protein